MSLIFYLEEIQYHHVGHWFHFSLGHGEGWGGVETSRWFVVNNLWGRRVLNYISVPATPRFPLTRFGIV